MLLFNSILLLHFIAFLGYCGTLALLWPSRGAVVRDKKGLILGITILLTGIALVALKYPHVNYYKVIPKLALFVVVTGINIRFGGKPLTTAAYNALVGATLLAACIAVVKV